MKLDGINALIANSLSKDFIISILLSSVICLLNKANIVNGSTSVILLLSCSIVGRERPISP